MKKIFSLLLCTFLLFSTFGFAVNKQENIIDNTIFSYAILNDGNSVTETFAVNLNKSNFGESVKILIIEEFKLELNKIIYEISQKITQENDENLKQKIDKHVVGTVEDNENAVYLKITYTNLDAWKYFSNSGKERKTEKKLFTFNYYDQIGMVGGVTNLSGVQQLIGNYLKEEIVCVKLNHSSIPFTSKDLGSTIIVTVDISNNFHIVKHKFLCSIIKSNYILFLSGYIFSV